MPDKPNVLVIWGDEIGITNLSCYKRRADVLPDAERRPDRRRGDEVHRRLRRAVVHRRPRVVPHRAERVPHRTVHGFDEFFGNLYHFNAKEEP
jgi:arylsulfatase A-like enzyme